MATWREQLQPASFRGVPFHVESESTPVGRRTQVHEFPQRNKPFVEDLGEQTRVIKFSAFVVGEDCFFQRDNLLHALNQPGPGTLVHPWYGQMYGTATDCSAGHAWTEGGVTRFELLFVESGEKGYPVGVPNTARQLEAENESLLDSAIARYKAAMALVNKARLSIVALQNGLAGVQMFIQQEISQITGLVSSVATLADMVANFPEGLADMLKAQFSSMGADFDRFSLSRKDASGKVDGARGIAALPAPAGGAATVAAVTATRELVRDVLIIDALRTVSAMPVLQQPVPLPGVPTLEQQVAAPVARPEVPATDDVVALRDAISAEIWAAQLIAPYGHFERLGSARKLVRAHLAAVAVAGVRLVEVTPKQTIPAVVLAYQQFGDASRADEIVTRNGIAHPGFLPPLPLKVAQE
ncbi:DNA circularization protein [Pseudomonas protegens]|uniref:DNA circularization protein n=1 Tax=Pseudomonas protegens TaxID=380021 RepID=UPI0022818424|nr:DNA circularization N-terminal domain-containing protein [Pseudomonas protegens]MCY7262719.1 DNA circularization N-terminal domain-containing protein [Pseudomonas protegens]